MEAPSGSFVDRFRPGQTRRRRRVTTLGGAICVDKRIVVKVSSEFVEFSKEKQGLYWDLGKAESCRKAEGVGMDQIGVEGVVILVMAEALMLALRKWGRKWIPTV